MKCFSCAAENKENAKFCAKCGADLTAPPVWYPTWKWHLKTLGIIYAVLIVIYIILRIFLK